MLGICALAFSVSSCYSPKDQNGIIEEENQETTNLYVTAGLNAAWSSTRAQEVVPVPITYYLFDSKGACVDCQVIDNATTPAAFSVVRDTYKVVAVCGESDDLPSQQNASLSDFYSLAADADICMGNKTVEVTNYGSTKEEEILVNHVFAKVQLSVTNVPSTVSEMSVTFGSLYDAISLNAEYNGSQDVALSLESSETEATKWELAETFMYPTTSETMSVVLTIKSSDGTVQTISTTTEYLLSKGKKTSLTAEFQAISRVIAGVVVENGWTEESGNINFWGAGNGNSENGGSNSNSQTGDNTQPGGTNSASQSSTTTYSVGDVFGDTKTFIYLVDDNGDGTVTLGLIGSAVLSGVTISNVVNKISSYNTTIGGSSSEKGIAWHVPSAEEWSALTQQYQTSASLATKMSDVNGATQSFTSGTLFITKYADGFYEKSTYTGNKTEALSGEQYYCVPFATYTVNK